MDVCLWPWGCSGGIDFGITLNELGAYAGAVAKAGGSIGCKFDLSQKITLFDEKFGSSKKTYWTIGPVIINASPFLGISSTAEIEIPGVEINAYVEASAVAEMLGGLRNGKGFFETNFETNFERGFDFSYPLQECKMSINASLALELKPGIAFGAYGMLLSITKYPCTNSNNT